MNIIFLGAPGVGKGTYTSRVKEKYSIPHISTGDIFRENIKNDTPLGKEAKGYIDKGQLVPDEVTINMVKERLSQDDVKDGYILDGFPRTIAQAEALKEFSKVDIAVNFAARDDVIIQRLSGRRICRKCGAIFHVKNIPPKTDGVCDKCGGELYQRDDDQPDAIKKRLDVYREQTSPLIGYYEKKGLLNAVDANSEDIDGIIKNLVDRLDSTRKFA